VPHKQVLEGVRLLVAQSDLADLPIEDLRKWGCWDQTEYVLSFADKPSHANVPIVKRAILRFALAAPPEKAKFVEQTLQDEQPRPAAAQQATTPPAAKPGGSN